MARFVYVRKFCIYAKFAYVCKSGHVYTALVALAEISEMRTKRPDSMDETVLSYSAGSPIRLPIEG